MYPKIFLAIDNCAFYKRWTDPMEWAEKISSLGLRYVEASADTELDPLYVGSTYLYDWLQRVRDAENRHGIKIANLYSGHGTYTTLGLTHPDISVRRNMIENWFYPMIRTAAELDAGIGFFAHAFENRILQDEALYQNFVDILIEGLSDLNRYSKKVGCRQLAVEQMYTPHQFPWRLRDTKELLLRVKQQSGHDFYFTEDLGHHHIMFTRPTREMAIKAEADGSSIWLGSDAAYRLWKQKGIDAWEQISADMDRHPSLFAIPEDGDCYRTLRTLGCYSPIIHLQQTNGRISSHLPFTAQNNENGIIEPMRVLKAIKAAYDAPEDENMPARCEEIYLTFEIFSGTTSIMEDVLDKIRQSVTYWRKLIPEDGMTLEELILEDRIC